MSQPLLPAQRLAAIALDATRAAAVAASDPGSFTGKQPIRPPDHPNHPANQRPPTPPPPKPPDPGGRTPLERAQQVALDLAERLEAAS